MGIAEASSRRAGGLFRRLRPAVAGYVGLAGLVALWAWRAFHDPHPWDTGLAYHAGKVAWATGHPEQVSSWTGTPFLGAVMALASRVFSVRGTADLVTAANVAMWVGAASVVLQRTRGLLSPGWWWSAAVALVSFVPLMSTVWFKQFNVIALVLALGGFELLRQRRPGWGAAAIGLSVAAKPLVLLLPLVMLARKATRRAGALALAWVVGLNVAAQGMMALRAHDFATLAPLIGVRNFLHKSRPTFFSCLPSNFAPVSLLCRVTGGSPLAYATVQRLVVGCGVVLLGAWVVEALRGRSATSWEVFAFACPLSVMLSAIQWTHYQIVLAPLFFLLLYRFVREGASFGAWAGLAVAFGLSSLIWAPYRGSPYGSIFMAVSALVGKPEAPREPVFVEGVAQLAQYLVVLTGILWYLRRRSLDAHVVADKTPGRPV